MVFEHEIPKGSRLYFGKKAKQKRELEYKISSLLDNNDFEEIITPNFSYSQHQSIHNCRKLIKFSDEQNEQVSLRADSTLDVVRIITKRLGRTTTHKKWFYIQPIFTYPSTEEYQIGCEWIGHDNIADIINLNVSILKELDINPILQIANIKIPRLVSKELGIDIELFINGEIAQLFELNNEWLSELLKVKDIKDLENIIAMVPASIKEELVSLLDKVKEVNYDNIVISPLYYGSLKYYDGIYYRVIDGNSILSRGGMYSSEGLTSLGFALYTDNLLKILED
ncbi:ATP phosphoribosyltransferase regulatory subunit [Malaciobacter mytili]|uniref:ATP phosphoribosyltransferase regulatory subunit n=1 Tax=Malaciobacter mytili LMG 24559 TaxID=1032238 RepID=A0AAX2ABH6_9BACT|nr:ATP phosphoribosyltransferase regulatory subunit [Malaciobacter mytili]AXH13778.1 ATP phosphoribosyltransferase HisG(S)Z, hetero-octameric short form, regulatory subunit [Malaciobacter mytili LMG 24559]RXI42149.1 ATP phosphoribosyltransferase regulatory subunit [Malaciobacter mytili]RXK12921.1 ATP phosphoribosyltransferase regulatory subunit [Malaciobacter mytili LMG 24559]